MSEKRFKLSKYVTPSSVSYFCDENGRMLNKEVVKVLNELNDENGYLKEENEQLKKARDESDKFIAKKGLGAEFLEWCVENE